MMKKTTMIVLALTAAVCCSAQNLIKNSDFQEVGKNGKLTGWKYKTENFSLVKSEEPGDEGKQIVTAQMSVTPEGEAKPRTSVHMHQSVQLTEARKYQLTLVGKADGAGMINCSWNFFDQDSKRISVKKARTKAIKGGKNEGWQTVTHTVEVPEEAKKLTLTVTGFLDKKLKQEGGTVSIKQVSLTPAAEEPKE